MQKSSVISKPVDKVANKGLQKEFFC
jgi:hypothetical protein